MPAAVLVVITLGSLAVDSAVVFGAQRDLINTAQAAANDAVTLGIDIEGVRASGELQYDRARIDEAIQRAVAGDDDVVVTGWSIDGDQLVVRLEKWVEYVFAKGVPGGSNGTVVQATGRARLNRS
ncbi:MAG: hypothetical protein ABI239_13235 [Aquihabitans sp.]